jgi:hypothetical protein
MRAKEVVPTHHHPNVVMFKCRIAKTPLDALLE